MAAITNLDGFLFHDSYIFEMSYKINMIHHLEGWLSTSVGSFLA